MSAESFFRVHIFYAICQSWWRVFLLLEEMTSTLPFSTALVEFSGRKMTMNKHGPSVRLVRAKGDSAVANDREIPRDL